jgi:hypothetical protein
MCSLKVDPLTTVGQVFGVCVEAVRQGKLIVRESSGDKEFHFQYWFEERLRDTQVNYERGGRNSYPDFRIVRQTEGYELKGLAYPGRDASFDSNSQPPTGFHNGRTIFYVFGRYPKEPDGNSYPVLDLVICHGDFLNADHDYVHRNKNVKGFGTYGDIMIRDRKMYVVPTPFRLADGLAHQQSLILPADVTPVGEYLSVGDLKRTEAANLIVGYSFDLKTNDLLPETVHNPSAGAEHHFRAWRLRDSKLSPVSMRPLEEVRVEIAEDLAADDGEPAEELNAAD